MSLSQGNDPPPTASQLEENDPFWQAADDNDSSALIGDLWTDIDIASLLRNTLKDTSYSRKRLRSELEEDNIRDT